MIKFDCKKLENGSINVFSTLTCFLEVSFVN